MYLLLIKSTTSILIETGIEIMNKNYTTLHFILIKINQL